MNERSKIIKLLINGNDHFKGKIMSITKNRFAHFNDFLDQLTTYFKNLMPNGIRRVYKYTGFQMIHRLDELENYQCYICCSHERLKRMAYDSNFIDKAILSLSEKRNFFQNKIGYSLDNSIAPNYRIYEESRAIYKRKGKDENSPKLVKIVFNDNPQDVYKIFINRNLEISLDECLWKISTNLNRKIHKHEKVKIFTVSGREITNMSDFYINRSPILAFTNPMMMYPNDVKEMILSLFPNRHRAERYFAKWLIEENSENSSTHSIRLKSSRSSTSETNHSNIQTNRYLTDREKRILSQINDRKLELENTEREKTKSNIDNHQSDVDVKRVRKESIKEAKNEGIVRSVDHHTQMTPRFDRLDKTVQATSNLRHFGKITETRPHFAHFMKITDVLHSSRHFDKVTQFLPRTNHFSKVTGVNFLPNFTHLVTEYVDKSYVNIHPIDKAIQCSFNSNMPSFRSISKKEDSFAQESIFLSEKYDLISILSKSTSSNVYLSNNFKQQMCVIKQIHLANENLNRIKEAQILMSCDHRNIIRCFEVYRSELIIEIVMEYFPEGNLDNYLSKKEIYEEEIMKMVKDVTSGLFYLHTVGIIHRNIQPRNIYFQSNPQGFLIGNMSRAKLKTENLIFTEQWPKTLFMAPELEFEKRYNEKVDIWSLGVIINNIVCENNNPGTINDEFIVDSQNKNWINWSSGWLCFLFHL